MKQVNKLILFLLPLFFISTGLIGQSVVLDFDENIEDALGNYTPTSSGEITFMDEDGRKFCRLSPGSLIEFPVSLSEAAFAKNSFEVSFDMRILDSDPIDADCCWQGFDFFSANENNTVLNIKMTNYPGFEAEWGFNFNDGINGYANGTYFYNDPDIESWRRVSLKFDISKNRWQTSLGDARFDGPFSQDFDFENFQELLTSNQIQIKGVYGAAEDIFIDIDNFRIDAPTATDNEALKSAFQQLSNDLTGEVTLQESEKESLKETIIQNLYFSDYEDFKNDLFHYTAAYEDLNPPLYENGQSFAFNELPLHDQVLQYSQDYVFQTQFIPGNIENMEGVAFEHAKVAPGTVPENTPRIPEATVTVNGSYHRDIAAELTDQSRVVRPTGYFVAAGDIVTITVPSEAVNKGLSIIVGAHFRNMDYDYISIINRFPDISAEYPLTSSEIKVANPFGGGIYLKVPEGTSVGAIEIKIENAVKSPYFSWREASKTDVSEWLNQVANTGAPWADFESDKFMFTIPTSKLDSITNPDEIMTRWDEIMDAARYVAGRPNERPRAEYYSFDTRLVTPAYGAGYPLIIPISEAFRPEEPSWNPLTVVTTKPHETLFHEMGHNHLDPTMAYGGDLDPCHFLEAESVNHMLATSVYSNVYNLSVNDALRESGVGQQFGFYQAAFDWIITNNFRTNQKMYLDDSAPLEESEMLRYQPRSWAKYADIAEIFGWEAISKVNGQFYESGVEQSSTVCDWRGYVVGRDEYIKAASDALGVNMTPLFHFWGINPSPELAAELQFYPQSPEIKARILEYRENVAPKTLEDYMVYHDLFPKEDYQYPRYEKYLQEFDEEFAADILAQFDFLIATYFPAPNTETAFLGFNIPEETELAVIDSTERTISITVSSEANLLELTPTFMLSQGASASINDVKQISGTSVVDFTNPVVYNVLAEDQIASADWTVTVNQETSSTSDEAQGSIATISPNPFKDGFHISFGELIPSQMIVYDLAGKVKFQDLHIMDSSLNIEIEGPPGIYILKVEWEGMSKHYKILKQ
ncbi:M60 family metallopeptidase [Portibacter lacus]|uniref:Peptidase M60 domain-containing protein n=1 Tax=Portibacter lacus TaxID=1099794 RepID=A0AA37SQ55_9BACT|nr:M60 family metallopeptidase [Portibacter lacus]GLR18803.1 hypothetical protein GCM10007940_34190 [Portibacter lacus]